MNRKVEEPTEEQKILAKKLSVGLGTSGYPFLPADSECTPAYNGCTCGCHQTPGMMHCVPCCGPGINDI